MKSSPERSDEGDASYRAPTGEGVGGDPPSTSERRRGPTTVEEEDGSGARASAPDGGGGAEDARLVGSRDGGPRPGARGGSAGNEDVEALRRSLAERHEQYLRLAADFENFKRRKAQELNDRSRYASEEAARALLPVLDNLRRAIEHAPEGEARSGLDLVVREFESAMNKIGVEPIEAVGSAFDPAVHEAMGGEESDKVDRDTVVSELQRGYRLHDRLLRPSLVRIAHPSGRA